jgi:protein-S-isoprenylcysteine O-methyltransferase Ste14
MAAQAKTVYLSIVVLAVQFALAIFARGGWKAFFSHPALVALVVVTLAAMTVAPFTSGGLRSGEKEDRGNRWVFVSFGAITLINAYLPPLTDRLNLWTLDGETIRWVGIAVYAVGLVLRIGPVFVLGKRFSGLVAIQPGHTLETGGIYGLIRNPSYLGALVTILGWGFVFRAGVGLAIVVLLFLAFIPRMHSEERLLREQFGAEYDAYFARTWRLIPWIY